ncbi:MAG TPA: Fic family protein, partial [Rhabdochlamydiaceae bacterium]
QFAKRTGLKGPLTECKISEEDRTMVFLVYFPLFPIFLSYFPMPTLLNSEQLTNKLILEFHQNLRLLREETSKRIQAIDPTVPRSQAIEPIKVDYQERAIRIIARLYAELEWIHPWHDGQGRTDLISLNGLLCQEAGLHPCILEYPYFSSSNSIDAWVDYLKAGLQEFNKTQKLNSPL